MPIRMMSTIDVTKKENISKTLSTLSFSSLGYKMPEKNVCDKNTEI